MKLVKLYIILIFGSLFFSCASIQDTNINLRLDKSNCFQEYFYDYEESQIPLPLKTLSRELEALQAMMFFVTSKN